MLSIATAGSSVMMRVLDANYILRYLLEDHPQMHEMAREVIEQEACLVPGEVIAEVVYVLEGYYETPRAQIAEALAVLMEQAGLMMHEPVEIMLEALTIYEQTRLDWVDCYLCALSRKYSVATFDKKLKKCVEKTK